MFSKVRLERKSESLARSSKSLSTSYASMNSLNRAKNVMMGSLSSWNSVRRSKKDGHSRGSVKIVGHFEFHDSTLK
jgi:hypothetical protein